MSAVKLERIDLDAKGGIEIHLSGIDILDGTPVLDIKPYLPFADCLPGANGGWADSQIPSYRVEFSPESLQVIKAEGNQRYPNLRELITQMLEWDPRPTSQRQSMPIEDNATQGRSFAFRLLDWDIRWVVRHRGIYVEALIPIHHSVGT